MASLEYGYRLKVIILILAQYHYNSEQIVEAIRFYRFDEYLTTLTWSVSARLREGKMFAWSAKICSGCGCCGTIVLSLLPVSDTHDTGEYVLDCLGLNYDISWLCM